MKKWAVILIILGGIAVNILIYLLIGIFWNNDGLEIQILSQDGNPLESFHVSLLEPSGILIEQMMTNSRGIVKFNTPSGDYLVNFDSIELSRRFLTDPGNISVSAIRDKKIDKKIIFIDSKK
jgi:hypothetical protein